MGDLIFKSKRATKDQEKADKRITELEDENKKIRDQMSNNIKDENKSEVNNELQNMKLELSSTMTKLSESESNLSILQQELLKAKEEIKAQNILLENNKATIEKM